MTIAKNMLLICVAGFVVSACGGGAATTDLPVPQGGVNSGANPYTGPVANDDDVLKFQQEFWSKTRTTDRCGNCHNESVGQAPMFVRNDDVNLAYAEAINLIDAQQPAMSLVVEQVGTGHGCWNSDPNVCGEIMTTWIENWVGEAAGGGRQIVLNPPESLDPGSSKNFPEDPFGPPSFESLLHQPILTRYCSGCHSSEAENAIQPYFADADVAVAYAAAKTKIDLDVPADSRLVLRLRNEFHNCWTTNCATDSQAMQDAIAAFSGPIVPATVDESLVFSKALRLIDGTVASGGNRYEDSQIALWEFKQGAGSVAFDSSGVDPAIDLNLSGDVQWYGGWGITIGDGKAQASTTASRKLHDILQESGEFSIEAWVIPANVTQEDARIVSYSAGDMARNFTLQQTLYDYNFRLRTENTDLNDSIGFSTPSNDEVLQATLQHVVATYNPIDGRRIFVNGELVTQTDPVPGGSLIDWQDTFAFVVGNEASSDGLWQGTLRLVAIHRRALTQEQVQQNFDVGVGEKFYMLFDISEILAATPQSSYILFEAAQYDSYAYLFDKPHFITLDGSAPEGVPLQGLRIGMNGQEVLVGQSYANLQQTLSAQAFGELGQPLSLLGAVLPLVKGPDGDEFFLTFDRLASETYARADDPMLVITAADLEPAPHVGIRTFDEINATFAGVTDVDPGTGAVNQTFLELRQSLPTVEDVSTFLSSHQVAIAQLAIEYCNALIEGPNAATYFPGLDLDGAPTTVLAPGARDLLVNPLIRRIVGNWPAGPELATQPSYADVHNELASFQAAAGRPDNLVDRLIAGGSSTRAISKGVCAATLGSAVTLLQ